MKDDSTESDDGAAFSDGTSLLNLTDTALAQIADLVENPPEPTAALRALYAAAPDDAASMDQAWARALDLIRADGLDPEAVIATAAETVKAWKMGPPADSDAAVELARLPTLNDLLWRLPEEIRRALLGGDPTRWRLARASELLLAERERLTEELAQMTARVSVSESLELRTRCAIAGVPALADMAADPLPATTYTHDAAKALRAHADEEQGLRVERDATIARLAAELADALATSERWKAACEKCEGAMFVADRDEDKRVAEARTAGAKEERDAWTEVTGADTAQALAAELDVARAKRRTI